MHSVRYARYCRSLMDTPVKQPRRLFFAAITISMAVAAAMLIYTRREADQRATHIDVQPSEFAPGGALTGAEPSVSDSRVAPLRESPSLRAFNDPLQALYAAHTLSDLAIASASLTGEHVLDAKTMEYSAERFCGFGSSRGAPARSFEEVTRGMAAGSDAEVIRSARWLDRLRASFCEGRAGSPDFDPLSALTLPAAAGLDELDRLEADFGSVDFDAEGMDVVGEEPDLAQARRVAKEELRTQVLDFMARTNSPAAFSRASEMLVPYDDWYPEGVRAKASRQLGLPHWRVAGSEIAFCRLAPSACAAGSLTVISRCIPLNCRAGESLPDYYRRTQSPQTIEIANAYADALLALRQGKP